MINEEKLMAEGTILYHICEIWENTHFLPFAPYRAIFANDVDTFLLTFSDDPIGILKKMTWFPGTSASSETVLNIYKELAELQECLSTEVYIPKNHPLFQKFSHSPGTDIFAIYRPYGTFLRLF